MIRTLQSLSILVIQTSHRVLPLLSSKIILEEAMKY
jgi:hypothetical protein